MKLTGAAILVSRGMKVLQRPRQLILIVRQDIQMRKPWIIVSLSAVIFAAVVLWLFWPDPFEKLQSAEEFILYSIDGREPAPGKESKSTETFHGYPVLGKVKIDEPEQRRKLIAALKDAIARKPPYGAKCFWPRHGIRAYEKGKTVEFVICFQCSRFSEYVDGASVKEEALLNKDIQPVFDTPLKGAGVPIAP